MRPPDFTIGPPNDVCLRRWYVIPRNRWFNIYLHQFLRSDDDKALHDHPWFNCSVLLRGEYLEHARGRIKLRRPWVPVFRRATVAHRVELIDGGSVWTLFLTGPKVRTWGFHCPKGWIPWTEFAEERPGGNAVGKGCGE
jgi:hypothetical protein